MKFRPFAIAIESPVDKGYMTYLAGHGTELTLGVYIWLIEGVEKTILVDTGASGEFIRSTGFPGKDVQTQESALKKVGLTVEDIDYVVLTHLHGDHAADITKYPNATFVVQKDELEYAKNPHPMHTNWFVVPPKETNLEIIDGDKEIVPGVKVIKTPGHTPGGQSILIDTDQGKVCLSGMCTILENFYPSAPMKEMGVPAIAPALHTDVLQAYDTIIKTKESVDIVIAPHDISYMDVETVP